jgi:hypothetical protein
VRLTTKPNAMVSKRGGHTDQLIDTLSRDVTPVRRLRPPLCRAGLWLAIVALISSIVVAKFASLQIVIVRAHRPAFDVELIAALVTGCLAVIAAFYLSLPDRPLRWALLPAPSFIVWWLASGTDCYGNWLEYRDGAWRIGESGHCFVFILGVGVPLSLTLLLALRRARPIAPRRVAVVGALGASSLTAFLLQFFHPFDLTLMDLAIHAIGVAVVVMVIASRPIRHIIR